MRELRTTMLVCEECKLGSDKYADGWRGYLALEDDGSESVKTFCPECAEEEFGN